MAPAPLTGLPNWSVNGPLPPLPRSDVQIAVVPLAIPAPFQLHGVAEQTTASTLPAPLRAPEMVTPPADFALKVEDSCVLSVPSCDQLTASGEGCPAGLVTSVRSDALTIREKAGRASAAKARSRIERITDTSIPRCTYRIQFVPPGGHGFAYPPKVPLSEYFPPAPVDGDSAKYQEKNASSCRT